MVWRGTDVVLVRQVAVKILAGPLSARQRYRGTIRTDAMAAADVALACATGLPEEQVVRIEWLAGMQLPARVTEAGRTTEFAYDELGRRLSQTITDTATGERRTWRWTYDANGKVLTRTDPGERQWTFEYDSRGNRIAATDPLGRVGDR